ncbi:unnamed protein product, partial [Tetraodon nigroviridis]
TPPITPPSKRRHRLKPPCTPPPPSRKVLHLLPNITLTRSKSHESQLGNRIEDPPASSSPQTVRRDIGLAVTHRFSTKSWLSQTCQVCQKNMMFGVKCKHCRLKCHNKCTKEAPSCRISFLPSKPSSNPDPAGTGLTGFHTHTHTHTQCDISNFFFQSPKFEGPNPFRRISTIQSTGRRKRRSLAHYQRPSRKKAHCWFHQDHPPVLNQLDSSSNPSSTTSSTPSSPAPFQQSYPPSATPPPNPSPKGHRDSRFNFPAACYFQHRQQFIFPGESSVQHCLTSPALLISTLMSSKTPCKAFILKYLNCLDCVMKCPVTIKTPLTSLRISSNEIEQSADDIRAELVEDEDEEGVEEDIEAEDEEPDVEEENEDYEEENEDGEEDEDDGEDMRFHMGSDGECDELDDLPSSRGNQWKGPISRKDSQTSVYLQEWDIPFEQLDLGELIGKGRWGRVHKGRWHGEVAIRLLEIDGNNQDHLKLFKKEVMNYRQTRHENVVLFMGACMAPPHLAIITSFCKGRTLYSVVRDTKNTLDINKTRQIAQEIVKGMGYLHAKGIVHKDLKSKNVFHDTNKVVITDFGLFGISGVVQEGRRENKLKLPHGWICYLAPEIVRKMSPGNSESQLPFSTSADVYASGKFCVCTGSLVCWSFTPDLSGGKLLLNCCGFAFLSALFGMSSSQGLPITNQPVEATIWQVGSGEGVKKVLAEISLGKEVSEILSACWAYDLRDRPTFTQLADMLEKLPKLNRRLSHPGHFWKSAE